MAEHGDTGIDPRFDPAFQRGYDPDRHRSRATRKPGDPPPGDPPTSDGTPPVEEGRDEPRPEARAEAPPAEAPAEPELLDDEPALRVIPFRLILLLASVAAIVGSALLLWARITADPLDRYYGSDPGILFRDQFVDALLVPLLIVGGTGLILWLAIGALRGRDDA